MFGENVEYGSACFKNRHILSQNLHLVLNDKNVLIKGQILALIHIEACAHTILRPQNYQIGKNQNLLEKIDIILYFFTTCNNLPYSKLKMFAQFGNL